MKANHITAIVVAFILGLSIVGSSFIYSLFNRYRIIPLGETGLKIAVLDGLTGKSYISSAAFDESRPLHKWSTE